MNRAASTKPLLRHFAQSEGLFRATALTANIVMTSLIAQLAGFGAEGILSSMAVQLGLAGLLEVPTGLLADRFGAASAVIIGLWLKLATTLSFLGATAMALYQHSQAAMAFLALEAAIDAFANALLNGAFQAAYLKWYEQKLEPAKIPLSEAQPLFLSSFRYALFMRLGLPLAFVGVFSLVLHQVGSAAFDQYGALLPVVGLLELRVITLKRIGADLKGFVDSERGARRRAPWSASQTFTTCLVTAFGNARGLFALNVFGVFISTTATMFFIGKAMQGLAGLGLRPSSTWTTGAVLGLACHSLVIVIGRLLYPKLARASSGLLFRSGAAAAFMTVVLAALSLFHSPATIVSAFLAAVSIGLTLLGGGIQRWAESKIPENIGVEGRATWLSLVSACAMLLLGATATLLLLPRDTSAPTVAFALLVTVMGLSIAAMNFVRSARIFTLRRFLTTRIIVAASIVCLTGVALDAKSTYATLRQAATEKEATYAQLAADMLREPLLQGSFVETKRRVAALLQQTGAVCLEIKGHGFETPPCVSLGGDSRTATYYHDVRFDPHATQSFATIGLVFDHTKIEHIVLMKVFLTLLCYAGAAFFAVMLLGAMAGRIVREFGHVQEIALQDALLTDVEFGFTEARSIATRLRKAVQDAVSAQKVDAILRTAQMVAHDVRKPFSTLHSALFLLKAMRAEPERAADLIERLEKELQVSLRRVDSMLADLMQVGGTLHLQPSKLELKPFLKALVDEVKRLPEANSIEFSDNIAENLTVRADEGKLTRVVANILENAVQAQPQRGRIWICASQQDGFVDVTIGNSDSFIPEDHRRSLFEPFVTHGKCGGTGLGLAIARRIVEAHGGRIACTSALLEGTQFTLSLPDWVPTGGNLSVTETDFVRTLDSGESKTAAAQTTLEKVARVLVVDDDPWYGEALEGQIREVIGTDGVDVCHASDSRRAMALIARQPFDLVICDFNLGHGAPSGLELAEVLSHHAPKPARFVLHSHAIQVEKLAPTALNGPLAYIPKPMSREALHELLVGSLALA